MLVSKAFKEDFFMCSMIDINKKVFSRKKMVEIREDLIVPDTKPDIVTVTDITANSYIYKTDIENGKLKVDGNMDTYIVYISENGDSRAINMTFNFTDSINETEIKEEMKVKYKIEISKIEAKVLNERKLNCVAELQIDYELYERQQIEINNQFDNIEGLQMKSEEIDVNSIVALNSTRTQIKEDIKVDNMDNIAEILRFDINIRNKETKLSYNKILAKADAEVCIIYSTEDNRISKVSENIPIMSFIDLENVKENNFCDVDYQMRNILLKINNQEEHSITCQIDFELECEAYESKQINIVSDLYSLKNDLEFSSKEIEVSCNSQKSSNVVEIEEQIEMSEVKKVIEIEAKSNIIKNNIAGNNSNIEGELELKIYYESTSKMGLNIKNVKVPFISKTEKIDGDINCNILKKEFDLNSNNLIMKLQIDFSSKNEQMRKIQIVENVSTVENTKNDDYSIVVYIVKPGDSLWKIAKKFKVTVDNLQKVNEIENANMIYPGDKLYVVK